ncbi:hypothetical protein [Flavobacterium quisquiliarum]|uniref:Uncharacterized protein n=1 Tax=Flavobacterium quisquiliarum TaxID=1834436 RepID=A0ABV8W9A1_9FLAO|nr:hypothetical protein [Flavobacterium quisquiliarum]MBW1655361.1 hypothetical protein [Flavobacterium quisquiliarum]NWL00747.1 hypothetical protein [Flavobacterium collinsii]
MKIEVGENNNIEIDRAVKFVSFLLNKHNELFFSDKKEILVIDRGENVYLNIGLGYPEGIFLEYVNNLNGGSNFVVYNRKVTKEEVFVYYYFGHYTEIRNRNLIHLGTIVEILYDFFNNTVINFNESHWEES